MLTHALREQFSKVRAFAFIDTCDEVTDYLRSVDIGDAMARIAQNADLVWFDGHSDYGHAFEVFAESYPDAITPKTSLLVLGDARNNHRSAAAPTVRRLVKEARHSYWLNPEPRTLLGIGRLGDQDVRAAVRRDGRVPQRRAARRVRAAPAPDLSAVGNLGHWASASGSWAARSTPSITVTWWPPARSRRCTT